MRSKLLPIWLAPLTAGLVVVVALTLDLSDTALLAVGVVAALGFALIAVPLSLSGTTRASRSTNGAPMLFDPKSTEPQGYNLFALWTGTAARVRMRMRQRTEH
jgi:hypothetical protein